MPIKTNPANKIVNHFRKYYFGLLYYDQVDIRILPWPWYSQNTMVGLMAELIPAMIISPSTMAQIDQ
jgi:hypothetical protein